MLDSEVPPQKPLVNDLDLEKMLLKAKRVTFEDLFSPDFESKTEQF